MESAGFSIPFSFNKVGKVNSVVDSRELWKLRVHSLMLTRFGERLMRPDFGTNLEATLFENEDLASEIAVKTISIAFNKWLPGLNLIEARPQYDKNSGSLNIDIRYTLPDGATDDLIVSTGILTRSGDLIKE
jgi:phage baseplate assembly protein W